MDPHSLHQVEDLHRRANAFLQALLHRAHDRSPTDIADQITDLAFKHGNPVRELFLVAVATKKTGCPACCYPGGKLASKCDCGSGPMDGVTSAGGGGSGGAHHPRPPSPADTIRPPLAHVETVRTKRSFLGFTRAGRDKTGGTGGTTVPASSWEDLPDLSPLELPSLLRSQDAANAAATTQYHPQANPVGVSQNPPRPPNAVQYNCIICEEDFSSKGVCKRHLEDQHISPRVFECESCHVHFRSKPEAKRHCGKCGKPDLAFFPTKPAAKKIYACEYTGSYFTSLPRYTDHLLKLCEMSDVRPRPSFQLKLNALLCRSFLRTHCEDISEQFYGRRDAWTHLTWPDARLFASIEELEHATPYEDGTLESSRWSEPSDRIRNTRHYVTTLFLAGHMAEPDAATAPVSFSRPPPPPPQHETVPASITRTGDTATASSSVSIAGAASFRLRATSTRHVEPGSTAGHDPSVRPATATARPSTATRSTMTTHDGLPLATAASQRMLVEMKSKRHLSDQSRFFVPDRDPPGPPDSFECEYQNHLDSHFLSEPPGPPPYYQTHHPHQPQPPPLTNLPFRPQNHHHLNPLQPPSYPHHHFADLYSPGSASSSSLHSGSSIATGVPSDAASDSSTLAHHSYHDPEPVPAPLPLPHHDASSDYSLWARQLDLIDHLKRPSDPSSLMLNGYPHATSSPAYPASHGHGHGHGHGFSDDAASIMAPSSVDTGASTMVDFGAPAPGVVAAGGADNDLAKRLSFADFADSLAGLSHDVSYGNGNGNGNGSGNGNGNGGGNGCGNGSADAGVDLAATTFFWDAASAHHGVGGE